jgi:hypothetical protein
MILVLELAAKKSLGAGDCEFPKIQAEIYSV